MFILLNHFSNKDTMIREGLERVVKLQNPPGPWSLAVRVALMGSIKIENCFSFRI
jgi:hypothetical protein